MLKKTYILNLFTLYVTIINFNAFLGSSIPLSVANRWSEFKGRKDGDKDSKMLKENLVKAEKALMLAWMSLKQPDLQPRRLERSNQSP